MPKIYRQQELFENDPTDTTRYCSTFVTRKALIRRCGPETSRFHLYGTIKAFEGWTIDT